MDWIRIIHLADVNVQSPETPSRFSLRLDVYGPPQVLQTNRCLCHPPLPPILWDQLQTAGPLGSRITQLPRYCGPGRHPLIFCRLPGVAGYTASLLRRFRDAMRRASPVALHILVSVASLSPRQCGSPRKSVCAVPCCLRPTEAGSTTGVSTSRGHLCIYFHYGPLTRCHPEDDFY
jgi:hypothetical protein